MRALIVLALAISGLGTRAQDWALLNPAYRYNYSNDGTDTISNQIRVMDIDTLGPDSFRYELNRIGVVCDTCPASLGGPCDGCFVRVDQPQFLGYECIRFGNEWQFNGAGTFLIRSDADIGTSWMFNATEGITASVDAEWPEEVFGVSDTLQRILLSDGDSILLSCSFGIVNLDHGDQHYDLIGVEGAGVGRLFPDPLDYFDYQPGDELVYSISSVWWANPPGGPEFPVPLSHHWKVVMTGRLDMPDTVVYTTSTARTYGSTGYPGSISQEPIWPMPQNIWSFNRTDILANHPILGAYPGQVMDTSICWLGSWEDFSPRYIARSGITADGRWMMRSQHLGQSTNGPTSGFNVALEALPGLSPFLNTPVIDIWYEEGLGICNVESVYPFFMTWTDMGVRVELVGAVIGGDTILPPPTIAWTTNIRENTGVEPRIAPNPASNEFTLSGITGRLHARIYDSQGRVMRIVRTTSENETVDVRDLNTGMYMVVIEGMPPQRLLIAR